MPVLCIIILCGCNIEVSPLGADLAVQHRGRSFHESALGREMKIACRVERALDIRPIRGQARSGTQKAVRYDAIPQDDLSTVL